MRILGCFLPTYHLIDSSVQLIFDFRPCRFCWPCFGCLDSFKEWGEKTVLDSLAVNKKNNKYKKRFDKYILVDA